METDQVEYLALLPHLKVLSIDRNPIELGHPNWVQHMQHLLPSLTSFNGVATAKEEEDATISQKAEPVLFTPTPPAAPGPHPPPPTISPQRHRSTRHSPLRSQPPTSAIEPSPPPLPPQTIAFDAEVQRPVTRQRRVEPPKPSSEKGDRDISERVFSDDLDAPNYTYQAEPEQHSRRQFARPPSRGGVEPAISPSRRPQTAARRYDQPNTGGLFDSASSSTTPRSSTPTASGAFEQDETLVLMNEYRPKLTVVRAIGQAEMSSEFNRRHGGSGSGGRLARESSPIAPALRASSDENISSS